MSRQLAEDKPIGKSKTLWINAIVLIIACLTFLLDHELIRDNIQLVQYGTIAIAVANILLRFLTVAPLRVMLAFFIVCCMADFASAQWVQRTYCDNGVCRTEWVQVRQFAPVQRVLPRISQPVSPALIVKDFPVGPYIVAPIADLGVQAAEALRIGDRDFVRKVREATTEGRKQGKLSALQQARILAAIRLPRIGREVEQMIAAEFEVPVSATGLIDWENFDPDKFLQLVEAIIKILLMFGIGG